MRIDSQIQIFENCPMYVSHDLPRPIPNYISDEYGRKIQPFRWLSVDLLKETQDLLSLDPHRYVFMASETATVVKDDTGFMMAIFKMEPAHTCLMCDSVYVYPHNDICYLCQEHMEDMAVSYGTKD